MTFDVDVWLKGATRERDTLKVTLDRALYSAFDEIAREYEQAEADAQELRRQASGKQAAMKDGKAAKQAESRLEEIGERLRQAAADLETATREITVEALTDPEWRTLRAEHSLSAKEQREAQAKGSAFPLVDEGKFFPALLVKVAKDPEFSQEQAETLFATMYPRQAHDVRARLWQLHEGASADPKAAADIVDRLTSRTKQTLQQTLASPEASS